MITLKFNNVKFWSQTEKQIDDTQKECTSQFMMVKKTIICQSAKVECKQVPVVHELSCAKINMKQRLFLDEHQCQDSNF